MATFMYGGKIVDKNLIVEKALDNIATINCFIDLMEKNGFVVENNAIFSLIDNSIQIIFETLEIPEDEQELLRAKLGAVDKTHKENELLYLVTRY
jgi:hypothetical protein